MTRRRGRGVTLMELMIAMVILLAVSSSVYAILSSSTTSYTNQTRLALLQDNTRLALDQMANELRQADRSTLAVTTVGSGSQATQVVTFHAPTGFAAGKTTWSGVMEYRFGNSALDNMVDGVTGEGSLVRVENGVTRRLCDYVKPGGFLVTRSGNNLKITLTLVINDERNRVLETVLDTSVTLRLSGS